MTSLPQVAAMAAIVATLVYLPLGFALALVAGLASISLESFVTFGGALDILSGLVGWWAIFFAGSLAYAAWLYPWEEEPFRRPRSK